MAQTPAPPADPERTRYLEPVVRPIVKATDLGSVQVLKQGNQYLLTDPFGDVHPDTRGLGLYDGDTRRLSCAIVRVNGTRPVLLQASAGGNWRGTIQMTNPRIEREPAREGQPGGGARVAEARASRGPGCSPATVHGGAAADRQPRRGARGGRGRGRARGRRRRHLRGPRLGAPGARPPAADRDPRGPAHVPLRRPGRDAARRRTSRSRRHRRRPARSSRRWRAR